MNKLKENDLVYYFKRKSTRKRFDEFNDGIKLMER